MLEFLNKPQIRSEVDIGKIFGRGACTWNVRGRTKTREAQSASKLKCAAGGATKVPRDHRATPARSTFVPPILAQHISIQDTQQRKATSAGWIVTILSSANGSCSIHCSQSNAHRL